MAVDEVEVVAWLSTRYHLGPLVGRGQGAGEAGAAGAQNKDVALLGPVHALRALRGQRHACPDARAQDARDAGNGGGLDEVSAADGFHDVPLSPGPLWARSLVLSSR